MENQVVLVILHQQVQVKEIVEEADLGLILLAQVVVEVEQVQQEVMVH